MATNYRDNVSQSIVFIFLMAKNAIHRKVIIFVTKLEENCYSTPSISFEYFQGKQFHFALSKLKRSTLSKLKRIRSEGKRNLCAEKKNKTD